MKRLLVLTLVAVALFIAKGTSPNMAYNVNSGALYFDPNRGTLSESRSPGMAQIQPSIYNGGSVQGASTGPTPEQQAAQAQATQDAQAKADTLAYLTDQAGQLRGLLGRTDTNLNQGLTQNEDAYNTGVGTATTQKDAAVTSQNQAKLGAYDAINRNAGNGYRSLAQIIGRASGTGSSAFRDLLPDVIGKDTSSKRQGATNTYGQNLSNIDTSFESTLADLLKQKKTNEGTLRSTVEGQRQDLQGKLAQNAGQVAQANGGGYAAVKAAQAPFQSAIENSRNAVEGFFNQFRTPYTQQAINPNLAAYQTDRSVVNANATPGADPANPYASLLRKKLQGQPA